MRILITGGTGFLGAAFVIRARAEGHYVVVLDREQHADIPCDVGDPDAVRTAVISAKPDVLIHLAAWLTSDAADDPVGATRVNALGTAALFAAAEESGAKRVIFASSIAAVGPCPPESGDAVILKPGSLYGVTKAFGEHLASVMANRPDAPSFLALRFGWVYGPGRHRGWRDIQEIIERVAAGERQIRYPDFPEAIDWTWIDDAVEVLIRSIDRPLPPFLALNVVGDKRRIRDAMTHLQQRFPDLKADPELATTPPSAWGLVNDGINAALGYAPDTGLERGLDQFIAAINTATYESSN